MRAIAPSPVRACTSKSPVGGALGVETLSLLPDLEDGFLDVVEAVTLRVAR